MATNFSIEELRKLLQQMETEELLSRYRRGLFNDEALPVAHEELCARDIKPPMVESGEHVTTHSSFFAQLREGFQGSLSLEKAFWGGMVLTFLPVAALSAVFDTDLTSGTLPSLILLGYYATALPSWLFCIHRCRCNTDSSMFSKVASHIANVGALSLIFLLASLFLR